jgi:hypothetical protein
MKPTIEGFTDFLLFLRTPYPRPLQTAEGKVACVTCPPITKDWTKSLANLIDWVCFYQIINFDKILDNLLTFVVYCSSSTALAALTLIILFLKMLNYLFLKNIISMIKILERKIKSLLEMFSILFSTWNLQN